MDGLLGSVVARVSGNEARENVRATALGNREATSMQAIGYKEVLDYLDGLCTLEQLKENIKNNTRHFSKRQITWFKREKDIEWLNLDEFGHDKEKLLSYMLQILIDKNIVAQ